MPRRPVAKAATLSLVGVCMLTLGCAGLIVREDDSAPQRMGKVTARVLLFVPTVGMSEATIHDLKEEERYRVWKNQAISREATEAERRDYLVDQKLLNVSELAPHELVVILAGDIFGASTHLADLIVFLFSDEDPHELRYLPPPARPLYPPIDRRRP